MHREIIEVEKIDYRWLEQAIKKGKTISMAPFKGSYFVCGGEVSFFASLGQAEEITEYILRNGEYSRLDMLRYDEGHNIIAFKYEFGPKISQKRVKLHGFGPFRDDILDKVEEIEEESQLKVTLSDYVILIETHPNCLAYHLLFEDSDPSYRPGRDELYSTVRHRYIEVVGGDSYYTRGVPGDCINPDAPIVAVRDGKFAGVIY